jgi:hypothetical protein
MPNVILRWRKLNKEKIFFIFRLITQSTLKHIWKVKTWKRDI